MAKFKKGDIVKYNAAWCSEGEQKYRFVVLENCLNPVTNEMTRYLIGCLNSCLALGDTETVDEEMIEEAA